MSAHKVGRVAGLIALIAAAEGAYADISDAVFTIQATNARGTGEFTGRLSDGAWDSNGVFVWQIDGPIMLTSTNGQVIAELPTAQIRCIQDPVVQLNFSVVAGNVDTTFIITSPLLSFPTINDGEARASAGVTVTDVNGGGATMNPVNDQPLYTSYYNGLVPGGTLFRNLLVAQVAADELSSQTQSDESAAAGAFLPIGPSFDMSSRFQFTLSAGDEASGTSTYQIREVPGPAAIGALGMGMLGLGLRRRR